MPVGIYIRTNEARRNIGKASKGRIHSLESKEKISEKLKGRKPWNKGKKLSERTRKLISESQKWERSIQWQGDSVGYRSLHRWITRWKGRPSKCVLCGTKTAKKYEWANIDHKYRRVLDDYIRLCTTCHRLYDYRHRNIEEVCKALGKNIKIVK